MMLQFVFPTVLTLLELGATGVYLWQGDWKHAVYWTLCAGITVIVAVM